MRLSLKAVAGLALGLTAAGCLVDLAVGLRVTLLGGLHQLQVQHAEAAFYNVENRVGAQVDEIRRAAEAAADLVATTAVRPGADWRQAPCLRAAGLGKQAVDLVAVLATTGVVVHGAALRPGTSVSCALPEGLVARLAVGGDLHYLAQSKVPLAGWVLRCDRPLAVATVPLRLADEPPLVLLAGRYLSIPTAPNVAMDATARLYEVRAGDLPADVRAVLPQLQQRALPRVVRILDRESVACYRLLADLPNSPTLILRTVQWRTIDEKARLTAGFVMLSMGFGLLFCSCVSYAIISRMILGPLSGLAAELRALGGSSLPERQITVIGEREVAEVAGAINQMLTEQAAAHQRQIEDEERYHAIIQSALDGIVVLDADSLVVQECNPALEALLGCVGQDLCGRSFHDLHENGSRSLRQALETVAMTGRGVLGERQLRRADGRLVDVEGNAALVTHGGRRQVFVVYRDIAGRKQAERERRRIEARIRQVDRLESLVILAGGVAHDFNNLLTIVSGRTSLLLMDPALSPTTRKSIEAIETASNRASELTRQLLAYAGKGRLVKEQVAVGQVVEETVSLLRTVVPKGARLSCEVAADLRPVKGDSNQIAQVVMNLVVNAGDALPEGEGVIEVRCGPLTKEPEQQWSDFLPDEPAAGHYVAIDVVDTGCGMDEVTRVRIFDPFFTTKFAGRGLGLAATMGLIRAHRGAVRVQSQPGQGANFRVILPCVEDTSADRPQSPPPPRSLSTMVTNHTGTILVVDDEPLVREMVTGALAQVGYRVLSAEDGLMGVQTYAEHQSTIDLVLLDMSMPRLDGRKAFERIKTLSPGVPVVLMTGHAEEDAELAFDGCDLAGLLHKPYGVRDLLDMVGAALQGRGVAA